MADPLSITTGVIALLRVTWTVGYELKQYRDAVNVVGTTIDGLEDDVAGLATVLESMRDTFVTVTATHGSGQVASHWNNIARFLDRGSEIIVQLRNEIQAVGKSTSFLDNARKQLRLNFASERIAGYRTQIQSYRDGLQLSLQTVILSNQLTQQSMTERIEPNLSDLQRDVRRIAAAITQVQDTLLAGAADQQTESRLAAMNELRECVKSAASIVSTASSVTLSATNNNRSSTVVRSDFGDVFPDEESPAIRRWMQTQSRSDGDQYVAEAPLSNPDLDSIAESERDSESDEDIEDEMTSVLLENGQLEFDQHNLHNAERLLRKCALRLAVSAAGGRSGDARKLTNKRLKVLDLLYAVYEVQERWSEAQTTLKEKLSIQGRMTGDKDSEYLHVVLKLARFHQKQDDKVQALLHARRALAGFKKLRSQPEIIVSLSLLIDLCRADEDEDDREIYAMMLAKVKGTAGTTTAQGDLTGQSVSDLSSTHSHAAVPSSVERVQSPEEVAQALPPQRPPPDRPQNSERGFVRQVLQKDDDLVHYETRPGRRGGHRNARLFEDLPELQYDRFPPLPSLPYPGSDWGPTETASDPGDADEVVDDATAALTDMSNSGASTPHSQNITTTAVKESTLDGSPYRPPIPSSVDSGGRNSTFKIRNLDSKVLAAENTPSKAYHSAQVVNMSAYLRGSQMQQWDDDRASDRSEASTSLTSAPSARSSSIQGRGTARSYTETASTFSGSQGRDLQEVDDVDHASVDMLTLDATSRTHPRRTDSFDRRRIAALLERRSATPTRPERKGIPRKPLPFPVLAVSMPSALPDIRTLGVVEDKVRSGPDDSHSDFLSSVLDVLDLPDQATPPALVGNQRSIPHADAESSSAKHRATSIVLVGDGLCGKSSLMGRFVDQSFSERWDLGYHHRSLVYDLNGESIDVDVWDIAGQEDFKSGGLKNKALLNAKCVLACFAIDLPTSLQNLTDKWKPHIIEAGLNPPIILVGCKSDYRSDPSTMKEFKDMSQRILTIDECWIAKAKLNAVTYLECSSKTSEGIDIVFGAAVNISLRGPDLSLKVVRPPRKKAEGKRRTSGLLRLFTPTPSP